MGFKCPVCHKDFGLDKNAFLEHVETCKDGEAKCIVGMYIAKNEAEAAIYICKYGDKLKEKYRGQCG